MRVGLSLTQHDVYRCKDGAKAEPIDCSAQTAPRQTALTGHTQQRLLPDSMSLTATAAHPPLPRSPQSGHNTRSSAVAYQLPTHYRRISSPPVCTTAMSVSAARSQEMYLTEVPLQDCTCHTPPYTACWTLVKPSSPVSPPSARGGHSWSANNITCRTASPRAEHSFSLTAHVQPNAVLSCVACASTFVPHLSSVLIFGGSTREARFHNDLALYNLTTNSWSHPAASTIRPPPRSGHTALLHGTTVLVYGGQHIRLPTSEHGAPSVTFYSDVWQLDLATFAWRRCEVAGSAPSRNGHTAWMRGGSMWTIGGSDESGPASSVWRLDTSDWRWHEVEVAAQKDGDADGGWDGRELHGMAVEEGGERVWLCGGRSENGVLTKRHALDLSSESTARWSHSGAAPARCAHSLLTLQSNPPAAEAQPAGARAEEEAKQQISAGLHSLSLNSGQLPSLLLFGGTDGLTFYNDLTVLRPPASTARATDSTACATCNGPLGCHRLGGGAKADNAKQGGAAPQAGEAAGIETTAGKGGKKRGKRSASSWPAHRFAHSLTAVRTRDGRAGYLLFGGMDEERDMNDAHVLTIVSKLKRSGDTALH